MGRTLPYSLAMKDDNVISENSHKALLTLELVKNEVVRPGRLFSMGQCVEIVKNLSGEASSADIHEIAGVILKDISLTTRVLQIANSIEYNRSGKRIVTVSQAIMVLGLAPIRSIAFSILLLEHLANHAQAVHIRNACLLSVMSGSLARIIAEAVGLQDPEQGFITSAFAQLGKILLATFLPEDEKEILRLMQEEKHSEEESSSLVLGMRLEQMGKQIGEFLNLPPTVTSYMDPLNVCDRDLPTIDRRVLQVAVLTHRACQAVAQAQTTTEMEASLRSLSQFKESAVNGLDLVAGFKRVVEEIGKFYAVRPTGEFWSKAMLLCHMEKKEPLPLVAAPALDANRGPDFHVLQDGVLTITELLTQGEFEIGDVLAIVAETLYLAFKARNVVVATVDKATSEIMGRAAYGVHASTLRESFIVRPWLDTSHLTAMALNNKKDIYIDNAQEMHIREHLPTWLAVTDPKSFFMLPILHEEQPAGLIYVDGANSGASKLSQEILRELKIMRRSMVLAIQLSEKL